MARKTPLKAEASKVRLEPKTGDLLVRKVSIYNGFGHWDDWCFERYVVTVEHKGKRHFVTEAASGTLSMLSEENFERVEACC